MLALTSDGVSTWLKGSPWQFADTAAHGVIINEAFRPSPRDTFNGDGIFKIGRKLGIGTSVVQRVVKQRGTRNAESRRVQEGIFCGLNLFRNRLHHIVDRSCARDRQLHVLDESLVVFGKSLQRCLGFHLHDLVAAGFQAAQQRW
jgi:hypothetical protein